MVGWTSFELFFRSFMRSTLISDMCAKYFLAIMLTIIFHSTHGQEKTFPLFVSTVKKCGYSFFPENAFNDSVQGILNTFYEFDTVCRKKELVFHWYSIEIDGGYNLAVTPEQIYFYSSHDNPNRNYLYWMIDIDSFQYHNIFTGLKKAKRLYSSEYTPHYVVTFKKEQDTNFPSWSKNGEWDSELTNYCSLQRRHHLEQYFALMNTYLPIGIKKVCLPSKKRLEAFKPKLTSYSKQELIEWTSQKKRKN
jgi:hypothetical protein